MYINQNVYFDRHILFEIYWVWQKIVIFQTYYFWNKLENNLKEMYVNMIYLFFPQFVI